MAKIERTKNATRNIIFGMILRTYQIIVHFLMCTATIQLMGAVPWFEFSFHFDSLSIELGRTWRGFCYISLFC